MTTKNNKNNPGKREKSAVFNKVAEKAAETFVRHWASQHGYKLVPLDPIKDSPAYRM